MTLRHLRIFVEVATTGKMCDAADNLYISQPTVSQAIKELEEHYGSLLFERLGRKLHITPFGEKLLFYSRSLLTNFDEMEQKMMEIGSKEHIAVGATITVGKCVLPDIINDIKSYIPNMSTYSIISNTTDIERKILKSELDIGIVEGHISNPNLIVIPAIADSLVLTCNASNPLAKKKRISVEDLNNRNFIIRENGSGTRKLFMDYLSNYNIGVNVVMESNCPGSITTSVIKNDYMSVMSYRLIEEEVKNKEVVIFHNEEHLWDRTFKIVYHKDKYLDEPLKKFISLVKEYGSHEHVFKNKKFIHT